MQIYFINNNCWVLASHQSQLDLIIKSGINSEKILTLYTHTRLLNINKFLKHSRNIKGILSISQNEKSRLIANNMTKKNSYYFPNGYNSNFSLFMIIMIFTREYDVLFSLSYQKKS